MGKTARVFITAMAGIFAIAVYHAFSIAGLPEHVFWAKKYLAEPAEILLAGDSRTYENLSPKAMSRVLPGYDIHNFGWSGVGFSRNYLSAIEHHSSPGSRRRIVVIGVTPWSLTPKSMTKNNFDEMALKNRWELYQEVYLYKLLGNLDSLVHVQGGKIERDASYRMVFHEDGWAAANMSPPQPMKALPKFANNFSHGNKVSQEMVLTLCETIRRWNGAGIRVFAYRPPTTVDMVKLENELSGYEENEIKQRIMESGAVWLEFHRAYQTCDGSHLQDDAALVFSEDLAEMMNGHLKAHPFHPNQAR